CAREGYDPFAYW
nr:immunoglobulin heavy chain junction region [Mus musculus]MBK4187450.1 immunoglobulin heavy chain junction region [Mus musculus]